MNIDRIAIINKSGKNGKTSIARNLISPRLPDANIVEIGESDFKAYIERMVESPSDLEDVDYFLIPVLPDEKIISESIKTARILSAIDVPTSKIHIIFSRVPKHTNISDVFSSILNNTENLFTVHPSSFVFENRIYTLLERLDFNVREFDEDSNDYRAALRVADNEEEQEFFLFMMAYKQRAKWAIENLDAVFSAIFEKE